VRGIATAKLDRSITILKRATGRDGSGRPTETWPAYLTLFAQVEDVPPSRGEQIADGINIAQRPCRIRIRYRNDITAAMQVAFEGRTLRIITMPAEIGRREWTEFMAEEVTPTGNEP
jgi:SPP1 family predicted phage head-tail adaptor